MCFQLLNVVNPNSPDNTCVFSIFEAPDTYTNISIALRRHVEEITTLQDQMWRYRSSSLFELYITHNMLVCRRKKIRVFMCGDYEFLCNIYGLSGAGGN